MKKSIAVALTLLGVLLLLWPTLSALVDRQRFLSQISNPGLTATPPYSYFTAQMGVHYQLAFWSTGFAVLAAALLFRRRRPVSQS